MTADYADYADCADYRRLTADYTDYADFDYGKIIKLNLMKLIILN